MTTVETSTHVIQTMDRASAFVDAENRLFSALGLKVRERWVELSRPKVRLRMLEAGDGPPVIHLPGGPCSGAVHAPLAAVIPRRRHLLLDRPGFGLSEPWEMAPDIRGRSIEMLVALLDALSLEQADFIGNSMGAGMALWLALAHPARVRSIALVGGAAMLPGPPLPFILRLLGMPLIGPLLLSLERPSPRQIRAFCRRFGHDPDAIQPAMLDVLLTSQRIPAYARAWRDCLAGTISWKGQRPGLILTTEELQQITCPVAFAWGADDPMVSAQDGRAAASHIPNARFEVVGTGHAPWLDDPAAVARVLESLLAPADNF